MKIQDLLRKDIMILDLQAISKEVAIDEMITKLVEKILYMILMSLKEYHDT